MGPPSIWRLGFAASPEGERCVHVRGFWWGGPWNHPGRLGEDMFVGMFTTSTWKLDMFLGMLQHTDSRQL